MCRFFIAINVAICINIAFFLNKAMKSIKLCSFLRFSLSIPNIICTFVGGN